VPIVPMACSGAHRVMVKRSLVIHPGEILVEFLEPIDASEYSLEERDILNERVRMAMAGALPPDQRPLDFPGANAEPAAS
jgi:1-acyl-sn-glycerol-3-phosphate acyltransferase